MAGKKKRANAVRSAKYKRYRDANTGAKNKKRKLAKYVANHPTDLQAASSLKSLV